MRGTSAINSMPRVTSTRCMSTAAPRSGRASASRSQRSSASSRGSSYAMRRQYRTARGGVFTRMRRRAILWYALGEMIEVAETTTLVSGPVAVTDAAAGKIQALLAEEQKNDAGLRVFVQGGGCSGFQYGLMIEEGSGDAESDRIFESNGIRLFVDPISVRYLAGAEVDFVDNLMGGGFTIRNPNAKSTCGCGQSFGV